MRADLMDTGRLLDDRDRTLAPRAVGVRRVAAALAGPPATMASVPPLPDVDVGSLADALAATVLGPGAEPASGSPTTTAAGDPDVDMRPPGSVGTVRSGRAPRLVAGGSAFGPPTDDGAGSVPSPAAVRAIRDGPAPGPGVLDDVVATNGDRPETWDGDVRSWRVRVPASRTAPLAREWTPRPDPRAGVPPTHDGNHDAGSKPRARNPKAGPGEAAASSVAHGTESVGRERLDEGREKEHLATGFQRAAGSTSFPLPNGHGGRPANDVVKGSPDAARARPGLAPAPAGARLARAANSATPAWPAPPAPPADPVRPDDGARLLERIVRHLGGIEELLRDRPEHGTAADDAEVRWLEDDELEGRLRDILRRQARRRGIDLS
jgi:hypothetical protein